MQVTDTHPGWFDIERMKEALKGPEILIPPSLRKEEILAYLDEASKKFIANSEKELRK